MQHFKSHLYSLKVKESRVLSVVCTPEGANIGQIELVVYPALPVIVLEISDFLAPMECSQVERVRNGHAEIETAACFDLILAR